MAEEKVLTRRNLLRGAGVSVAGLAMASTMGVFLTGCAEDDAEGAATNPAAPDFPWNYEALDIEECKAAAYENYMAGG